MDDEAKITKETTDDSTALDNVVTAITLGAVKREETETYSVVKDGKTHEDFETRKEADDFADKLNDDEG